MFLARWRARRASLALIDELRGEIVAAARRPALYRTLEAPDRVDGRFELLTLHVGLVLRRLVALGGVGDSIAQDLVNAHFMHLDDTLREQSLSDVSVAKRLKTMKVAFYGRNAAYAAALDSGSRETLAAALARNVYGAPGVRRVVMLTGDHPEIAKVVADELGIDEWRAEVLPEDKLEVVRKLQDEGYIVGMVGDGINDAPALAAANIGIAMGLAGTDVAVETADVALANDDLRRLLDVRDLGARAVDVIQQNYGMSIAAAGLLIGAGGALSPVLAAILHNASSVAVVANSSRLIRYRLD